MTEQLQKVIVNCAAAGARGYFDEARAWRAQADEARSGEHPDMERAGMYDRNADACSTAGRNALMIQGLPEDEWIDPVSYVPLTDEDHAQRELDQAAAVEHRWASLRTERNARLTASDWTQAADAPAIGTRADWARYRQELRDLPENIDDPNNPIWPTPPGG